MTIELAKQRDEILQGVLNKYQITMDDLRSECKAYLHVYARREAAIRLRGLGLSFPRVGRILNRDHSTIVHACKFGMPSDDDVARVKNGEPEEPPRKAILDRLAPKIAVTLATNPVMDMATLPKAEQPYARALRNARIVALRDLGLRFTEISPHVFGMSQKSIGNIYRSEKERDGYSQQPN